MLRAAIASILMACASAALADYTTWRTAEEDPQVFQQINEAEVMYCRGDVLTGAQCAVLPSSSQNGVLRFEKRPFEFEVMEDGNLKLTNVIRETETVISLEKVESGLSAAKFVGKWGGRSPSDVQIIRMNKDGLGGAVRYTFQGDSNEMRFRIVGNLLLIERPNNVVFYFLQVNDNTFGMLSRPDWRAPAQVLMKAQPYEFRNDAVCAQSYLNFLGFDVGKADGQPGRKSKAGSMSYLEANPSVDLEPLSRATASAWCQHLSEAVDANPGSVAVAGL